MNTQHLPLLSILILTFAPLVGGVFFFFLPTKSKIIVNSILALSLGIFLGQLFLHHIPEWLHFSKNINPFQSSIFLGFGVLVLMGFELLQEVIFSKHDGGETSFPVTILFGNFFHSLMDGILVVYSFQLSVEVGWLVCVGILMHELPKSISFISIFVYSGIGKIKSTFFVFISGMGILWGMSLGKVMSYLKIDHADNVFPISTGILLFLALSKIYPEVRSKTKGELLIPSLLFFFLGLGIVYTIRNFFSGGYE